MKNESNQFWLNRHKQLKENGQSGSMSSEIDERMLAFFKVIQDNIKPKKAETVMDYGCSVGKMTEFLKEFFIAKKYIGYDIIDFVIADNKKKFSKDYNFKLAAGDLDKSDIIWCSFLLQHMDDEEFNHTLNKFKKALKAKGKIYIVNAVIEGRDTYNMYHRTIKDHEKLFKASGLKYKTAFLTVCGGADVACFEVSK
ncbi:MAG: class I SAM-dependent methyltransferase [Candidatus Hodarchaeales archaeon]